MHLFKAANYVDQQSQTRIATYLCTVPSLDNHRQSYLNRLELNDLYNVKLNKLNLTFHKEDLLDMEEDDDPLDDFLDDTPLDRLVQEAKTLQPGVDSIEFSGKEKFKLLDRNLKLKYKHTLRISLRRAPGDHRDNTIRSSLW